MRKSIVLFISIFILSACATVQRPKVIWPGQNFDNYITTNGVPTSQYTLQNGNTVFSFKKTCYYDSSKTGETIVIVGKDNIIESLSTTTKCPSYYDSNQYKIDQIYRQQENEYYKEQQHQFEEYKRTNKIAGLNMAIDIIETQINLKQTKVNAAEFDVSRYTYSKNEAALAKAKEELKQAQNELRESQNLKAQYEREIEQLKSMQ